MKKSSESKALVAAKTTTPIKKKLRAIELPDFITQIPPEKRREFFRQESALKMSPNKISRLQREKQRLEKEIEEINKSISSTEHELNEARKYFAEGEFSAIIKAFGKQSSSSEDAGGE